MLEKNDLLLYKVYVKDNQAILVDLSNTFVYETSMYLYYDKYFSLINKKYFSSKFEINGVVGSFWKTKHIQICSELFSAPEQWLIDNNFIKYNKKDKKLKIKKVKLNDK